MARGTGATGRRGQRPAAENGDLEQAVCDAAEALLAERPLTDISVAQILERAGVSRASFYFYFASKHAVLERLAERVVDEIYAGTQTWLHRAAGEPPQAALRAAMSTALALWREHGPVLRAMVDSSPAVPEIDREWHRLTDRFTDAATAQIERERRAGVAPPGATGARALAATLMWMTERSLYQAISGGEPAFADDEALVSALTDVWWRAIYAPAPG